MADILYRNRGGQHPSKKDLSEGSIRLWRDTDTPLLLTILSPPYKSMKTGSFLAFVVVVCPYRHLL